MKKNLLQKLAEANTEEELKNFFAKTVQNQVRD